MPIGVVGTSASFPSTGANWSRGDAAIQIAQYVGGQDDADVQARCAQSWDRAVADYNEVPWKFNRMRQSITLTATNLFDVDATFRSPRGAMLLDSNAKPTGYEPIYIPYSEWYSVTGSDISTGNLPQYYTLRNAHETGQVLVWPTLATPLTYPTLQLDYHRWIAKATSGVLAVPRHIDEGILEMAIAIQIGKSKGVGNKDALAAKAEAERKKMILMAEERDFTDYGPVGGWQ